MTKLFVIFNPAARGDKARRVRHLLEARTNRHVTLAPTEQTGDATRLAAQAARDGYGAVIAAGGDGTINEVVSGLGGADVALGVLPAGTVNVFARELGIPLKLEAAWAVVERGGTRQIDLGVATKVGQASCLSSVPLPDANRLARGDRQDACPTMANGARYFVQLAGAGFDARAVERANWELKKKIGPLSYVWAGLEAMARPGPMIETDNGARGAAVLIGNGRYYGGSFSVFPRARLDDGLLDVCVFERVRWRDLLRFGPAVLRGRHTTLPGVTYFQTREFHCHAAGPVPFEVDGELAGRIPVRFSVSPRALRVIVP